MSKGCAKSAKSPWAIPFLRLIRLMRNAGPFFAVKKAQKWGNYPISGLIMDKYGNPWPKYRVYGPKMLSPLNAVRHKCLDCNCASSDEVSLCPVKGCSLWPYRFGSYPENHQGAKTVLRPIKAKCEDCVPEKLNGVRDCAKKCCPLWPYRLGTNPKLKGRGGTPPIATRFKKGCGAGRAEIG